MKRSQERRLRGARKPGEGLVQKRVAGGRIIWEKQVVGVLPDGAQVLLPTYVRLHATKGFRTSATSTFLPEAIGRTYRHVTERQASHLLQAA